MQNFVMRALRDVERALPRHGLQDREGTALFTNNDGTPLTSQALDTLFKACLSDAGLDDRTLSQRPRSLGPSVGIGIGRNSPQR